MLPPLLLMFVTFSTKLARIGRNDFGRVTDDVVRIDRRRDNDRLDVDDAANDVTVDRRVHAALYVELTVGQFWGLHTSGCGSVSADESMLHAWLYCL